jgi:hypothetical protein
MDNKNQSSGDELKKLYAALLAIPFVLYVLATLVFAILKTYM